MEARDRLDDEAFRRLRWRARRGLLECDLLITRFLDDRPEGLTKAQAEGFATLLDLDDPTLLDLLLGRREPEGELDREDVRNVLTQIRTRD